MEIPGSSSCLTALQESAVSDEDPEPRSGCGQQSMDLMNLPVLAFT